MENGKRGRTAVCRNLARKNRVDAMSKFYKIKRVVKQPRPRSTK